MAEPLRPHPNEDPNLKIKHYRILARTPISILEKIMQRLRFWSPQIDLANRKSSCRTLMQPSASSPIIAGVLCWESNCLQLNMCWAYLGTRVLLDISRDKPSCPTYSTPIIYWPCTQDVVLKGSLSHPTRLPLRRMFLGGQNRPGTWR